MALAERSWWRDAACAGSDSRPFFPERGKTAVPIDLPCFECSVRRECLTYAFAANERDIYGGLSQRQRRQTPLTCGRCHVRLSPEGRADVVLSGTWICAICRAQARSAAIVRRV